MSYAASRFPGISSNNMAEVRILTPRFLLQSLVASHVTERYRKWLDDEAAQRYITASARPHNLAALRAYVEDRLLRDDVLFLGIFTRDTNQHIGNIKYEPVDSALGFAVMGMLIGEPAWRGQAVAQEIIAATAAWLRDNRGIKEIVLGVHKENAAALVAYERAGFVVAPTAHIAADSRITTTMVLRVE